MRALASRWLPLAGCLGLVAVLSTAAFSAGQTAQLIAPLVHWLSPGAGAAAVAVWNHILRKSLHAVVYGMLALSWCRALGGRRRRAVGAWTLAVIVGILDELHQEFVPGRTAQMSDVVLDAIGAGVAVVSRWGLCRADAPAPTFTPGLEAWDERG